MTQTTKKQAVKVLQEIQEEMDFRSRVDEIIIEIFTEQVLTTSKPIKRGLLNQQIANMVKLPLNNKLLVRIGQCAKDLEIRKVRINGYNYYRV